MTASGGFFYWIPAGTAPAVPAHVRHPWRSQARHDGDDGHTIVADPDLIDNSAQLCRSGIAPFSISRRGFSIQFDVELTRLYEKLNLRRLDPGGTARMSATRLSRHFAETTVFPYSYPVESQVPNE